MKAAYKIKITPDKTIYLAEDGRLYGKDIMQAILFDSSKSEALIIFKVDGNYMTTKREGIARVDEKYVMKVISECGFEEYEERFDLVKHLGDYDEDVKNYDFVEDDNLSFYYRPDSECVNEPRNGDVSLCQCGIWADIDIIGTERWWDGHTLKGGWDMQTILEYLLTGDKS